MPTSIHLVDTPRRSSVILVRSWIPVDRSRLDRWHYFFRLFLLLDMHGEVLHGVPFDIPTWSCLSSCHDYFWTGV